jgi:2-polyprenyl-6-methoxyphenol hydroxylase-like FAD-dependent oxidoreductase
MALNIAIVGGGICGLSLAMNLHRKGIACRVYERATEIKELGVGITLLPHAMREFDALGIADELLRTGIENVESCFFNRFGQLIYKEPRGKLAGYKYLEVGIHRGRPHLILYKAVLARLGAGSVVTDHECTGFEQDENGVNVHFKDGTGKKRESVRADAVVACDGINSAIRKKLFPNDAIVFAGINTWRGVITRKPILTGKSYMRVGSILTGKVVIYPIIDDVDGEGNQLINWMAEIKQDTFEEERLEQEGRPQGFPFDLCELEVRLARRR